MCSFSSVQVRDDQMVLNTKILNLQKKWNEYCLRLHQGCQRINRDPHQLFPHYIGVPAERERGPNPSQGSEAVVLHREVIKPSAVSASHTNATAKSMSSPSISNQRNADLVLNLQVRQSKSDEHEPRHDRAVQSQHSNSSNCDNREGHVSPSSAAPVATDLVLGTPRGSSSKDSSNALCKHVQDAEGSIQLMPKKVDDLNLKLPQSFVQPYSCSMGSSKWGPTSPSSAVHSAASGGTSAFGQWQRPPPLAAQSFDLSNYKLLMECLFKVVGRQEEALSAICASIVRCRSMERSRGANKKKDIWFSFHGPDSIAKRRVAGALAELMHGSSENLIYLDLSLCWGDSNFRGKTATDCIVEELKKKRRSVIFLDNIEKADCLLQDSLTHAMETGRYKDLHGGRVVDLNDSIVVLCTRMIPGCEDGSLGIEEGHAFSEQKIVAARGHQLKIIIVGSGTTNIGGGKAAVVSSRDSLSNIQASLFPSCFSKRKLNISDGQEKLEAASSTYKRLHRTSSVPFDLNLPVDEADAHDGDDDSSSSSSSHENSSVNPDGSVENLLRSVDESINFKPINFGKLCEQLLQDFSNSMSNVVGSGCRLEIDVGAMEQILAAAWASGDSEEKRPARTWVEQVFVRSLEQLKVKCKNVNRSTLRLVACEDALLKDEGYGALLPSTIILD